MAILITVQFMDSYEIYFIPETNFISQGTQYRNKHCKGERELPIKALYESLN